MKKQNIFHLLTFVLVLFALMTTVSSVAAAPAAHPPYQSGATATVGTGALNVRSGPGVGYSVVTVVYSGHVVTMLGRNSNSTWVKVRVAAGHEGWVSAPFIIPSAAIASLPVLDGGTPPSSTPMATVATGALNVRTGPGVNYSIITAIHQGTTVTLLGRNGNGSWVKVRLSGGSEGWVNASLITPTVAIATLPVLDSSTPGTAPTARVATGALNVRYGPGVNYGVITAIQQGTVVTLLGRNSGGTWVKVRLSGGTEGWVNASLVTPSVAIVTLPVLDGSTTPPPPSSGTATATVTTAANIRSGPGTGYHIVGGAQAGQVLTLLGRNHTSQWVQVRLANGTTGWIHGGLVTLSVPLSGLPITG
ncbi:MAG: SH3 domain-containing protein [Anaerolineae bacterium]|nr:SH3 domain-containing protein [Anaerolineae bacterium]